MVAFFTAQGVNQQAVLTLCANNKERGVAIIRQFTVTTVLCSSIDNEHRHSAQSALA
jgi:hypothetical protein